MFAFIDAHCTQFRVTWLCHRFDVTPSGFYAWRARGVSDHAKQDRRLTKEMVRMFTRHHERYGGPRRHRALVDAGRTVSRLRVARRMAAAGLRVKAVRGYRAKAAVHQRYARHPNLLWKTTVTATHQVCVGDITYFKLAGCWWYLAIVMDQFSRRILAWSLTRRRTSGVTCAVLAQAVRRRPAEGVIFHRDRGTEYMGAAVGDAIVAHGMRQRASVRGPGDNAHAESFWHSLKAELTRGVVFLADHALRTALRQYIRYYSRTRLHSSLNYTSPIAFERCAA
ncbi:IS3 family transposase [Gemmatimonas sp.]|uniref:IS3 family transposase n=1 Tax=Gemmatimonas sp. TaxID=1962908 RepID=UPI00286A5014|nr:IS3 family transposase [Gemmatimonas sp.]